MKNENKTHEFFLDLYHEAPIENDYGKELTILDCNGLVVTDPDGERYLISDYEIKKVGGDLKLHITIDWDV